MSKFRILHILGSATFGGIEKLVFDLTTVQKTNKNLDVRILFLRKEGEFLDLFLAKKIPCYFSNISSGYDVSLGKYLKIYRILKKFDVIHIHSFNPILAFFIILTNRKIVYTIHSVRGYGRVKKKNEYLKNFLHKIFICNFVDFITYNSNYTKNYWTTKFHLKQKNQLVIYNGINFSSMRKPGELSANENDNRVLVSKFIVGTSSRFIRLKRIELLIEAFAKFQEKVEDCKLILVGDGPVRNELEMLIKKYNIKKKTVFTGYKKNVQDFQNIMDVCVFPATTETFGLVAIETLSLGKPTIVFNDGGGITEIVEKISPKDVVDNINDLRNRLMYYYLRPEKIKCKEKERIKFARKFDIVKMENEMYEVYYEIFSND